MVTVMFLKQLRQLSMHFNQHQPPAGMIGQQNTTRRRMSCAGPSRKVPISSPLGGRVVFVKLVVVVVVVVAMLSVV